MPKTSTEPDTLPGLGLPDLDPKGEHLPKIDRKSPEPSELEMIEPDTAGHWPTEAREIWGLPEMPPDASWPRFMTAKHPNAVGTRGWEFLEWAENLQDFHTRKTDGFRWWQKLVALRALEIDADGKFVWSIIGLTLSRQIGKSWLARALIFWRIHHAELFGEQQAVLHVAHKIVGAQEVWRPAARWAERRKKLGYAVRRTNGEQQIETPDGSRWLIAAANESAGPSFSLGMSLIDEAWRVAEAVFDGAINPTHAEAEQPQAYLVSTAGDSSSKLMIRYRMRGLAQLTTPRNLLWIEWSAPPGAAITDESGWRAASPHFDDRRRQVVADNSATISAAQFRTQWLNQWVQTADETPPEYWIEPAIVAHAAHTENVQMPLAQPCYAAVETTISGHRYGTAAASRNSDGTVVMRAAQHTSLADAAAWLGAAQAHAVICHESLRSRLDRYPELSGRLEAITEPHAAAATATLRDLILHSGIAYRGDVFATEMADVVTRPATSGEVIDARRSRGDVETVKAAAYAVWAAENRKSHYVIA
jgi:hypothetical protein